MICYLFQKGEVTPVSVKVGDKVLLPEYGGTKLVLEEQVCIKPIKGNSMRSKHVLFSWVKLEEKKTKATLDLDTDFSLTGQQTSYNC